MQALPWYSRKRRRHLAGANFIIHKVCSQYSTRRGRHPDRTGEGDGKGNRRSGLLGIVLPDMYDTIYVESYICSHCGKKINTVRINPSTVIKEFSENYYLSPNCEDGHCDESGRFCVLVKYQDFMKDPDKYINEAYDKTDSAINKSVHWKDIDHTYKK